MLFAYILTKSRHMVVKIVRHKDSGFFKKSGFEYVLDRNAQYTRRWFGFKIIFWSLYLEGNPKPLVFDDKGYSLSVSDVPIDEIALIVRKVAHGLIDIVIILLIVFNIVLTLAVVMGVFNPSM